MKLNISKEELKKRFPNLTETEVDELFNFDLSISSPNAVNLSDLDNNDSIRLCRENVESGLEP